MMQLLLFCVLLLASDVRGTIDVTTLNPTQITGINDVSNSNHKVLVIILDGFRWDWLNTSHTSACPAGGAETPSCSSDDTFFTSAQRQGSTAAWNTPVFPTNPLPNLFTVATGLLPVHHGVLGGPASGWVLSSDVTPLWQTAADDGKKVALLRWISCADMRQGPMVKCMDHVPLHGADNLLVQLTGDAALASEMFVSEHFDIVLMRTELISWVTKHHGTRSSQVRDYIKEMELILEDMFNELKAAGIWDQMSVVITSSSGLTSTSPAVSSSVSISDCLHSPPHYRYHSAGSAILTPLTTATEILDELDACEIPLGDSAETALMPKGAVTWYRKTDLPPTDQWKGVDEEILIVAAQGFVLRDVINASSIAGDSLYNSEGALLIGKADSSAIDGGRGALAGCGYDTEGPDMNGVLIAKGPGIRAGITGRAVLQTDVYQLIGHMANLQTTHNQGQLEAIAWMFEPSGAGSTRHTTATVLVGVLASAMSRMWN